MKIKITGLIGCAVFLFMLGVDGVGAVAGLPPVRIGIVIDGPWARHPEAVNTVKKEIVNLTADEFDVIFPADAFVDGDWSVSAINHAVDGLMSRPDVDIIVALGYGVSNEVCKRRTLKKPVIAAFILDAQIQNLPAQKDASGVRNLCYVNTLMGFGRDIQTFKGFVPFKHLSILVDSFFLEAIPQLEAYAPQLAREYGIDVSMTGVGSSVDQALGGLPAGTDAVLVTPLSRISSDGFRELAAGLIRRRLPSFSYWGGRDVELGILASMTPGDSMDKVARSVAVNVLEIARGTDAGTLPFIYAVGEQLTINMATARAIDFYPSLGVLTEAELINEERKDISRELTLEKAVKEAVQANLDLAAQDKSVAAGEQRVLAARSRLLPQVGLESGATAIDADRARAGAGINPERAWTGTAYAKQLIYSDKTWADYTVQQHLQVSRVEGREAVRLDIVESAAIAYLNVLRAKTIERIQKENLKLTRANLERARVRVSIGVAGPDEVYRWESEIALRRQIVLQSESRTMDAMQALNRILNRPIRELFRVKETELDDPLLVVSNRLFFNLVNNPKHLKVFRDFMVKEGLEIAPELRQFEAEIKARERVVLSARREFYLPTFSVEGSVTQFFAQGGEGQRDSSGSNLDDTDWSVGVYATFPLFTSGGKTATYSRTREDLARLKIQREATAERIEQRILNAINFTRASYPSIQLSRDAAEAANKNLDLVTDSYSRGIKSIIDLLDAQNQALSSDQRAANAVYDFLIDLMRVQRAVGKFYIFQTEEEQKATYQKIVPLLKGAAGS